MTGVRGGDGLWQLMRAVLSIEKTQPREGGDDVDARRFLRRPIHMQTDPRHRWRETVPLSTAGQPVRCSFYRDVYSAPREITHADEVKSQQRVRNRGGLVERFHEKALVRDEQ
jgi:hypothetical protein